MDFEKYYKNNETYITFIDNRLKKIIRIILNLKPKNILDIGCGSGVLLNQLVNLPDTGLYGIDVYDNAHVSWHYTKSDITKGLPYEDEKFECIVLGEVIEHVPNPDFLLSEINRILKNNGVLIISTPNLVSWANRILVVIGIQPFFTETSSELILGRYFKILGQGNKTQGHLKIFTYKSLEEILLHKNFIVKHRIGATFFFPFPFSIIDSFFQYFISLASNLIYIAIKK